MTNLSAPISREPWIDPRTGMVSRFWQQFLTDLFLRVGGATAPTNSDIAVDMPEDAGIEELRMALNAGIDSALQVPPQITIREEFLESQIRQLSEEVAALRKELQGQQQGTML